MSPRRAEYEPEDLDDDPFFPPPVWSPPLGPSGPVPWLAHPPPPARLLLPDLEPWVEWLAGHYTLDHRIIPPCWAQHWELIEELSALHTAWQDAYAETSHGDAPLTWHERFAPARQRLTDWVARTGCRANEHRTPASVQLR